ncbi:hypothetical protein AAE02nite_31080 [Adhaeribacter aerolatus]|uniref:STAS/SEC14 domain-containing protein n=1 Tax=Adhaeribacter aerolatus TaxID=670289 RepID=A0A512B0F9_9BACT|nr:STAS/SEC14 domain-containing protein [Adhaeribacter aerolatus]GEO05444.1 hypothetical protein AAE02nite_31080 [Adhaeribacter aerolatus]
MVSQIATVKEDLVAVSVSGNLEKHDYDQIIPVLEMKIAQFGKINLYWEMIGLEGWHLSGLWQDLKFDVKHINNFRKIAIVGDKKWEEWIATMIRPFTTAEVKYYNELQREDAMAWVSH